MTNDACVDSVFVVVTVETVLVKWIDLLHVMRY